MDAFVSISDDRAIAGGTVFERDTLSGTWSQLVQIPAGGDVSISGHHVILGTDFTFSLGREFGSATIYNLDSLLNLSFASDMSSTENEAESTHSISVILNGPWY